MQRIALAIIGLVLTFVGGWLSFATESKDIGSIMFRSGFVISLLALALPQVQRFLTFFPPWLLACGAVGGFAILRWPRVAVFVLPALVALWFLGPRAKAKRATSRPLNKPRPTTNRSSP